MKVIVACVLILVVPAVVLFVLIFGGTGWHPNPRSDEALRAHRIDRMLRIGSSRSTVTAILNEDALDHPDDATAESLDEFDMQQDAASGDCPKSKCKPPPPRNWDYLMVTEHPTGINFFDDWYTDWTVQVRFDNRSRLKKHWVEDHAVYGGL